MQSNSSTVQHHAPLNEQSWLLDRPTDIVRIGRTYFRPLYIPPQPPLTIRSHAFLRMTDNTRSPESPLTQTPAPGNSLTTEIARLASDSLTGSVALAMSILCSSLTHETNDVCNDACMHDLRRISDLPF